MSELLTLSLYHIAVSCSDCSAKSHWLEVCPPPVACLPTVQAYNLQESPSTKGQYPIGKIPLPLDIHSRSKMVHKSESCYCQANCQIPTATEEALSSKLPLSRWHEKLGPLLSQCIQWHSPDDVVHPSRHREPAHQTLLSPYFLY